jgi:t-SNARE complex subunit (syntaxin)
MLKTEVETHKQLSGQYMNLKNTQSKVDSIDFGSDDDDKGLLEDQQFKVAEVRHMEEIAEYRKGKLENIQQQTYYVGKITKDINLLTTHQHGKVEKIHDNLDDVVHHVQETFNSLLKTSKEERNFKDNKCCVILLITLALFFLILIMLNMNR